MSAELRTMAELSAAAADRGRSRAEAVTEGCLARIAERNRRSTPSSPCSPTKRWRRRKTPIGKSQPGATAARCTACRSRSRIYRRPRHAHHGRVARAEGHVARRDATVVATPARGRRGLRRQDQPSRVRARHDQRGLGVRSRPASARRHSLAGRLVRRIGGVGAGRTWRTPRSAPTPADRSASRRRPAASSGLKPTLGEIPTDGIVPLSETLDHVGPLCRSVEDAALLYRRAARRPESRRAHSRETSAACGFGIPRPYFFDLLDPQVLARFEESCDRLQVCRRDPRGRRHRARERDRGDLPAHRAARSGGVSRNDAREPAARLHARTCACGSRWALHPGRGLRARACAAGNC